MSGVQITMRRGNFDGKREPAQDMPGHVQQSIYSKRLSRGQNRFGVDTDWDVLDGGHISPS